VALLLIASAQIGRPQPTLRPAVVLDGRELPVGVTIAPTGPLFSLKPLVDALGGELAAEVSQESVSLKIEGTEVVVGSGSAVITVGESIVSLSQPVTPGPGGFQVPLDFLRKTWGDLAGYSFDWRPEEARLLITRRESREIKLTLDVVHLQGMTTVVLQFPETPRYRLNQQPGMVEVQMLADRLAPPPARKRLEEDALVRDVAVTPQAVRVQLAPEAAVESYVLENPFRLVFDVHRRSTASAPLAPPLPPAAERGPGIHTIVVDPGHGGVETGAIGTGGVQEKNLTLELARDLAARLEQRLPVKVVLTRGDDTAVPLDTRTAIANQNKADLFISIHLNSSLGAGAHGAETYFLSAQASDLRAASAAAAENALPPAAAVPGVDESRDLRLILWDLAQSRHLAESQRFASLVQAELNDALNLKDRGVKQAPFRVLMGAAMPAVLVEVGFLSNAEEETKLQNSAYRASLVEALVRAVARYRSMIEAATVPGGVPSAGTGGRPAPGPGAALAPP
jgi:N-acetylmuramoyl-L-alanine amidase